MDLKVIRYKNYGCTLTGGGSSDNWEDKFYFSFYELNNGNIIELNLFQSFKEDKLILSQYDFSNTKHELKNGEVIEYKFGNAKPNTKEISDEFFDWFDYLPPAKDIQELSCPSENEEKCVKEFFNKNILETKEIATNIVNV
tara:strand:+ start:374 stop:796 length:423 start_codon:yes stop_codon:yes gene_type:complete